MRIAHRVASNLGRKTIGLWHGKGKANSGRRHGTEGASAGRSVHVFDAADWNTQSAKWLAHTVPTAQEGLDN